MSFLNTPAKKIVVGVAGVVLVLGGAATAIVLMAGNGDAKTPAAAATPVISGVARPDASCVTTDGNDRREYWDGNGWWAGRIDGDIKQMPALNVLALKLGGHQINSVWICAPRSNG